MSLNSHDVARLAGVSQSTVSLVLSGKAHGRVSAEGQRRVVAAAKALGYRPHASAQTLRSGQAKALGLFVPDVTNPFLGRVLRGAQHAAREQQYSVILVEQGESRDWQLHSMESMRAGTVDGLLLCAVDPPAQDQITSTEPIVLIESDQEGFPSVTLDVTRGADLAFAHLTSLGHRNIAHLAAAIDVPTFRIRGERWAAAMDHLGIPPKDRVRTACSFTLQAARQAGLGLLTREHPPTAVFCDDDLLAAGVCLAAQQVGTRVPGDLSIVGFAGTILSEITSPPITTVMGSAEDLGAEGVHTICALLRGEPHPQRTILPMSLEARGSSAPPRRV